jgi:hypothetical protein
MSASPSGTVTVVGGGVFGASAAGRAERFPAWSDTPFPDAYFNPNAGYARRQPGKRRSEQARQSAPD